MGFGPVIERGRVFLEEGSDERTEPALLREEGIDNSGVSVFTVCSRGGSVGGSWKNILRPGGMLRVNV